MAKQFKSIIRFQSYAKINIYLRGKFNPRGLKKNQQKRKWRCVIYLNDTRKCIVPIEKISPVHTLFVDFTQWNIYLRGISPMTGKADITVSSGNVNKTTKTQVPNLTLPRADTKRRMDALGTSFGRLF